MLTSLKIQNVALIPEVEIEFGQSLNVLTGETGAGKSIVLGAINFILGEKLNKTMIRSGAPSARVDAVFNINEKLGEQITELCGVAPDEGTLIISRVLKPDGKSDSRINGVAVTGGVLRAVADTLVNIHGQHETETLLKPKNHIDILDAFGVVGADCNLSELIAEYKKEFKALKDFEKQLVELGGNDEERQRQIDIYRFQVDEIERAGLQLNEDIELLEKKTRMNNFEKINTNLSQAAAYLGDDEGAISMFKKALASLSVVSNVDEKLGELYNSMAECGYALADIESEIGSYLDGLEFNPDEFDRVDKRLDEIKALRRKYGENVAEILKFCEDARAKMDKLINADADAEKLKKEIAEQRALLMDVAVELSEKRKQVAWVFEQKIVEELKPLGMPSCSFNVRFETGDCQSPLRKEGIDTLEFYFSANKGEELKPLSSVISGGELSRVMLVLKSLSGNTAGTLVFDEIDTGIGGNIGLKIAEKMKQIANGCQVIAVTHLPQIAAVADVHFLIEKCELDDRTQTTVKQLDDEGKKTELARMTAGW